MIGGTRGIYGAYRTRAMTLVEVLAVIVLLGLITATLAINFSGGFAKGKRGLAKAGIGIIAGKLEQYKMDKDAWPSAGAGLAALSDGAATPTAPYYLAPSQLLDPWGHPYALIIPGPNGHPYEIISYGADGQSGGEGENADISSVDLRAKE